MAKKKTTKTETDLKFDRQELQTSESLFSNAFTLGGNIDDGVCLNFGLNAPSYFQKEDGLFPVARIILPWHAAIGLSNSLKELISEYNKVVKTPKNKGVTTK